MNICFGVLTLYLHLSADEEMSYDHLASGLKVTLESDKSAFDADRLQKYTGKQVSLRLCLLGSFLLCQPHPLHEESLLVVA